MKSSVLRCLRGILFTTGLLIVASGEALASFPAITFNHVNGLVTSVSIDPLAFELTADYTSSQIQVRIFDLYPGTGTIDGGNNYTGFDIQKNADVAFSDREALITPWSTSLGGNSTDGDMIMWINIPFSFVTGDSFTVSGTGISGSDSAGQFAVPTSGTYAVHLISGVDGSSLATPILANIVGTAVVPEPGTYAAMVAGVALGFAVYRRRRSTK